MASDQRLTNQGRIVDVVGGLINGRPPQTRELLLDVDLAQLDPCRTFEFGSWAMAVETEVLQWPSPAVGPSRVCPLVARVSLGSGGAQHTLELDALPGFVIQLPGYTARCELVWDDLPSQAAVPAFNQWVLPDLVRVRATVFRGQVKPLGHRSFLNRRSVEVGVVAIVTDGRIPKLARSCMVYGLDTTPVPVLPYDAVTAFSLVTQATMGGTVQNFTGAQLQALKSFGARIPITSQMTDWSLTTPAGVGVPLFPVIVDFEISI